MSEPLSDERLGREGRGGEVSEFREWQRLGGDNWAFGRKVRGLIRHREAEVYYDDEKGWVWFILPGMDGKRSRGLEANLALAVAAAEKTLGISEG